jgi:hypothetical protein
MLMIIEGLLTTTDEHGAPHVAPMGPLVNPELTRWTLRPFVSSTTYRLLRSNPNCVFHVVDDVVGVVESALGLSSSLTFEPITLEHNPEQSRQAPAEWETGEKPPESTTVRVWAIPTACHWYHLQVTSWEVTQERSQATARMLDQRVLRPFWGWNRAKHAVLEATILATRLHLADRTAIDEDLNRLKTVIAKTAGPRELLAWQMLHEFFETH